MPEHHAARSESPHATEVMRLLVPGTLCDGRLFAPVCAQWPSSRSVRLASLHALRDAQGWWLAQLKDLPACFDVVGFSLGGLLVQALLRIAPERVRSMVLIASSADAASATHQQRWQTQQTQWQHIGPRALVRNMAQEASPGLCAEHLELLQDMAHSTPEASFMAQGLFNAHRPSGLETLFASTSPLCLISGALDPWCTGAVQERILQVRPDAQHHVIRHAGHYLPLEAATEVAQGIEDFLSSLSPFAATP